MEDTNKVKCSKDNKNSVVLCDNSDRTEVKDEMSISVNVGPEINCDNIETVKTKDNYICFSCNKRNPFLLTISNTISFVFGTFLDNICCCISSTTQRALATAVLTLVVVGGTTGGIVGRSIEA